MKPGDRVKLSKLLSLILRHNPELIGVHLKENGFTEESIEEIARLIRKKLRGFNWVTANHIREVVEKDPKGRFEIKNDKIRALYGHTVKVSINYAESKVPEVLFHGTSPRNLGSILKEGLKPMKRQKVHLTSSPIDAYKTALRKTRNPVILIVNTRTVHEHGIKISKAGKNVYVCDKVPPDAILLFDKYRDERITKIVFISPCILNPNIKAMGLVKLNDQLERIQLLNLLIEKGISVEMLPCPEKEFLGLYRIPKTKSEYEGLGFREFCGKLARKVFKRIMEYINYGFDPVMIIGVARSPSCSNSKVYIGSQDSRELVKGRGIFMEELEKLLKTHKIRVKMLDWDHKSPILSLKFIESILRRRTGF
ncbi:MAG TPA: DUF523 domain-containing protein [Candidatus Bathyarchaeota archaeon]|nr:DUF523 domain-containing protein [Candidatus Bathyarchaeota archaeon]